MKFGYVSWLPETNLVAKVVEGLRQGKLLGTQCSKCHAKFLPPRAHCKCGSDEMEWFEAPRTGKLVTYTRVTYPPESMSKHAPYVVAVAELENGSRLLAQVTGVTPDTLRVDLPMQVVPHQVGQNRIVYVFKPLP